MDYRKMILPSNSNSGKRQEEQKKERPQVNKVINGGVVGNRHEPIKKVGQLFFAEDMHSIKNYVIYDVIIPAIKNIVADSVTNSISMALFGDFRSGTNRSGAATSLNSPTKYATVFRMGESPKRANVSQSRFFFENPIVESTEDAQTVIRDLQDLIEAQEYATVADLYSMLGLKSESTYNNYGWYSISKAKPIPVKDGWVINLPKPVVLN